MKLAAALVILSAFFALEGLAQDQTSSSKVRPSDNTNAQGNVLGQRPDEVLKIVKVKGEVRQVDLEQRTISLDAKKNEDALVLAFAQPAGREQIKVSKKAAKAIGKKKLLLEELEVGAEVEAQYYPSIGQLLELVVE